MMIHDFRSSDPFRPAFDVEFDSLIERLALPYTGQARMRLTVASGLADARVRIDPEATDLITIDCDADFPPELRVSASELRLCRAPTFWSWVLTPFASSDLDIVLHPAVAWTLDLRGGLAHVELDLAAGILERLDIRGGVSETRIDLPAPSRAVPLCIRGGASEFELRRPREAGIALAVSGGIAGLSLDEQRFDAVGGGARLASGLQGEGPRYAIDIRGGASGLHIGAH